MINSPETKEITRFSIPRMLIGLAFGVIVLAIALVCVLIGTAVSAQAASPSPVKLELTVMKEQRTAASDGTTKIDLVPVASVTPGDRLLYVLTYTNAGDKPVADMVLDYPLPEGVAYRATADGSLPPLVSADGEHFTPSSSGQPVTTLRWQVPGAVAAGGHGQVSFKAALN